MSVFPRSLYFVDGSSCIPINKASLMHIITVANAKVSFPVATTEVLSRVLIVDAMATL